MIVVSYLMKIKIKKFFLELISKTKMFNLNIFLNKIVNDQDFVKLIGD